MGTDRCRISETQSRRDANVPFRVASVRSLQWSNAGAQVLAHKQDETADR